MGKLTRRLVCRLINTHTTLPSTQLVKSRKHVLWFVQKSENETHYFQLHKIKIQAAYSRFQIGCFLTKYQLIVQYFSANPSRLTPRFKSATQSLSIFKIFNFNNLFSYLDIFNTNVRQITSPFYFPPKRLDRLTLPT